MSSKPFVIVVGIDYSAHTERTLLAAFEHARKQAPAELHIAHASPATPNGEEAFLVTSPLSVRELKDELAVYVGNFLSKHDASAPAEVRVISHVVVDAPAQGVTELAAELAADLIVVGTHGRSGVARWLLGSVAEGIVRRAPCPVLVIPPEREQAEQPSILPPCPRCVDERRATAGRELWCQQHRERHGRVHTYHQSDRVGADTNMPLVMR